MSTPTPRWGAVTVDCFDLELMTEFWAALLGTSARGRWEQYAHLQPVAGGPAIAFQRVTAKSAGKNALHLDVHVDTELEVQQVVRRAQDLGARLVEHVQQGDVTWVVLADPEENVFCVVAP